MAGNGDGIQAFRLDMDANGNPFVVHAALLWDEQEAILVDTGIPGQLDLIRKRLAEESIPLERLTKIIITHQDRDHIGSLPELLGVLGDRVQVLAHETAIPYITGEVPLIKSKALAPSLPVPVTPLQDGDVLPYAGGIRVIHTPGHTPDHISLYHEPSKTLITGDALTSGDGVLQSFDPKFTADASMAIQSVRKLLELDIERVIAYHGGVCVDRIAERLREIVDAGSEG
ncbi:MBL fold metallo-hydrolase [Paenibacillus soyae]|uniref:MBL fold metallo-hydrolase n=1 Tax=Paenibacillus soyae TaxID=2969249 RepID=A0A9X2SBQ3_9BACL|nr:MBL fold metallo-hydrolase [Paenibacillus soyae]MCR2805868.1 MBL fold metallo-hydrolase [Paenibacillus soyae]